MKLGFRDRFAIALAGAFSLVSTAYYCGSENLRIARESSESYKKCMDIFIEEPFAIAQEACKRFKYSGGLELKDWIETFIFFAAISIACYVLFRIIIAIRNWVLSGKIELRYA